jgi:hypothetical protein
MYSNHSVVVDLRRNAQLPRSSRDHTSQKPKATEVESNYHYRSTPLNLRTETSSEISRDSFKLNTPNPSLSTQRNGLFEHVPDMNERLSSLETRFSELESRQIAFESDILSIMKSISQDIQEIRARNPTWDNFPRTNFSKSTSPSRLQASSRGAILDACSELERLVSEARSRTETFIGN